MTYLYSPFRCQTCIDGSAEFSDVSVSDTWTRAESGNYLFHSKSKVLIRTEIGKKVVTDAIQSKSLIAEDVTENWHFKTHKLHTNKKGLNAPLRVERLKKKGVAVPEYDRIVDVSASEYLQEVLESGIMSLGRFRIIGFPLFKFLTSDYGIPLVKIRQFIKNLKYRKKSV